MEVLKVSIDDKMSTVTTNIFLGEQKCQNLRKKQPPKKKQPLSK